MNHIDQLYLQIIYNTCVQNPTDFITIQPEDEQPLTELTKVQSTLPFLLSYIKNPTILNSLKHQTKLMMLNYYQIEQFTRRIADLLEKNGISYVLLKGISLADFYPVPEYRKLGDVDIYINDKEMFNRAEELLLANGYTKDDEISDHHQGYLYPLNRTTSVPSFFVFLTIPITNNQSTRCALMHNGYKIQSYIAFFSAVQSGKFLSICPLRLCFVFE